jgi:predicted transposase YbfD/YdcC
MAVKENHPLLWEDLETLFADRAFVAQTGTTAHQVAGGHGRVEVRTLRASAALVGYTHWPGLAQALCLERQITNKRTGERTYERRYAVTSLPAHRAPAAALLPLWREHWTVENGLHWVRDVTMGEDASRVRSGAAPEVVAALRNTVIGLLHATGHHAIAAARRRFANRVPDALTLLGLPGQ